MTVYYKYEYINYFCIWERNTETRMERFLFSTSKTSYTTTPSEWVKCNYDSIEEELKEEDINNITRISKDDAFLEMI